MSNEEYLGDGLYVSFHGWQFCLRGTCGAFAPTPSLPRGERSL